MQSPITQNDIIKEFDNKQNKLSTAQQNAVDSGITSTKVGNYDSHLSNTSNPHSVTASQVGLGNCDNTSDLNKPISTATQTALDGKQATIDSSHKLDSDLVDDTSATNKFVTASDKTNWNNKISASSADTLTNKSIDIKDNIVTCTATVISTSQTITLTKQMNVVIDTANIVLTLGSGPYDGYELPILAQQDCTLSFTGINGVSTMTCNAGAKVNLVWNDTYWRVQSGEPITGIDDDGQPFAYNIDSLVEPGGLINITGKDADGNDFDYGLTRLVTPPNASELIDFIYPVGSIYMSVNNVSPATFIGGTWVQIKDTFLLSAGDTYTAGNTGGEATHTLTTNEMPVHDHKTWLCAGAAGGGTDRFGGVNMSLVYAEQYTEATGGGQAHNNMPPYLVVYMWKRTA